MPEAWNATIEDATTSKFRANEVGGERRKSFNDRGDGVANQRRLKTARDETVGGGCACLQN